MSFPPGSYDAPEHQPADCAGLRKQMEWCQQMANNVRRRGYGGPCYGGNETADATQSPAKRLKAGRTQMCSECLFNRCLQTEATLIGE